MYTFPCDDLDRPAALTGLLGSFWTRTYTGHATVQALATAKAALARQSDRALQALIATCGREHVPLYHIEDWQLLVLRDSQRATAQLPAFDGRDAFDGARAFGVPVARDGHAFPAPPGLVAAPLLVNRMSAPGVVLVQGVDFVLQGGQLIFRDNPMDHPQVAAHPLLGDDATPDRQALLWICRGRYDRRTLHKAFGYAIGLDVPSSPESKELVNAVLDSFVHGTTAQDLQRALAAITGVPLVRQARETVEAVYREADRTLIVTDREVYRFAPGSAVRVRVGQTLRRGQALSDGLQIHEFHRGQCPAPEQVPALALGRGFLDGAFYGDLVFENKDVPLQVDTDAEGVTRVRWALGGWPGDVELFFELLHERGKRAGRTLAQLLDVRGPAAPTQPTAASLPATINPLAFVCANVLRHHAALAVVRPVPGRGLGLETAKILARVIPPQTALLLLCRLEHADAPITMEGPGTGTQPGYAERGSSFVGNRGGESLDPSVLFRESVRARQIGGHCV